MVGDALTEFLRAAMSKPFVLGQHDCGLWLADWYMAKTGKPDPASSLRGRAFEDIQRHMQIIIEELSLEPTAAPERGDIGLLYLAGRMMGAICSGHRWMVLSDTGGIGAVPVRSARLAGAWKIA